MAGFAPQNVVIRTLIPAASSWAIGTLGAIGSGSWWSGVQVELTNVAGVNRWAHLYVVPSGQTVAGQYLVAASVPVPFDTSQGASPLIVPIVDVLGVNWMIHAATSGTGVGAAVSAIQGN